MRKSYLSNRPSGYKKGQWFLISTVMVSAAFLMIAVAFEQYHAVDTATPARMSEDFYFWNVKEGLAKTVEIVDYDQPDCNNLETKLDEFIHFSEQRMSKMGYFLYVTKDINCPGRNVNFGILLASPNSIVFDGVDPTDIIPGLNLTVSTTTTTTTTTTTLYQTDGPEIIIISPLNILYERAVALGLEFMVMLGGPGTWCGFELDNSQNVTMLGGDWHQDYANYKYRREINITNPGSDLYDYQVAVDPEIFNTSGLVASYHFSEGSGRTASDSSPSNNDGTYGGYSLDFTSDFISFGNDASLQIVDEITIETWIKIDAKPAEGASAVIMDKYGAFTGYLFRVRTVSGNMLLQGYIGDGTAQGTLSNTVLGTDQWYHVVMVAKDASAGGKLYLYINGNEDKQRDITRQLINYNVNAIAGSSLNGKLDEYRIYNTALDPDEIARHYNGDFSQDPTSNLVGAWHMDEDAYNTCSGGEDVCDSSSYDNHGTTNAAWIVEIPKPLWTTGINGTGAGFNGVSSNVEIPDDSSINAAGSLWTVSAWIKTTQDGPILYKNHSSNDDYYTLSVESGKAVFRFSAGGATSIASAQSTTSVNDGNWHYIVGIRSEINKSEIYVDGDFEVSNTYSGGSTSIGTDSVLRIGRSNAGNYFNGTIDEVKIYNRILSESEIDAHYQAKSRLDYRDVRFTWLNSTVEQNISYWFAEDNKIWVNVPELPASTNTTIYMYYGSGDDSASNASGTCPLGTTNGYCCFYYDDFETNTWAYSDGGSPFTGSWATDASVSPTHAYKISYPSGTPSSAGWYGRYTKAIDVGTGTRLMRLRVRDTYTGGTSGYHFKRVYVGGTNKYNVDVAGGSTSWTSTGWMDISEKTGSQTVDLRVQEAAGVSTFGINVWWDDLLICKYDSPTLTTTLGGERYNPYPNSFTFFNSSMDGGQHTVKFWCEDTIGNTNYSITTFTTPNYFRDNFSDWDGISASNGVTIGSPSTSWLSGYGYRKAINIDGSTAGQVTNYQMKIIVHKGGGTDSGNNVYLDNNCLDNFNDIRFTDSTNNGLDYWIEDYISGSNATVWIEFDNIPASPSTGTFYIYYNKSDATSGSDHTNTFLDDAEDWEAGIGSWTGDTAQLSEETTIVHNGAKAGRFTASSSGTKDVLRELGPHNTKLAVNFWIYLVSRDGDDLIYRFENGEWNTAFGVDLHRDIAMDSDQSVYLLENGNKVDTNWILPEGAWYEFIFSNVDFSSETYDFEIRKATGAVEYSNTGIVFYESTNLINETRVRTEGADGSGIHIMDSLIIRNYADPEPTINSFSTAQTPPTGGDTGIILANPGTVNQGNVTSVAITPPSLGTWLEFCGNDERPSGTDIVYSILDENNDFLITDVSNNCPNLAVTLGDNETIKLFAELTTTNTNTPVITSWNMSWTP